MKRLIHSSLGAPLRRPLAVTLVWTARLTAAYCISRPLVETLTRHIGFDDRHLFEPGGLLLLEVVRLRTDALVGALWASLPLLMVFQLILLGPVAALLAALNAPERLDLRAWFARTGKLIPRFTALALMSWAAAGLLVFLSVLAIGLLARGPWANLDQLGSRIGLAASTGAAGCVVCLVGLVHDLARAVVVRDDAGIRESLGAALKTLARRPFCLLGSRLLLFCSTVVLVAVGAIVVARLDVAQPGGMLISGVRLIHQSIAWLMVAGQACFLAALLRWAEPLEERSARAALAPPDADRS